MCRSHQSGAQQPNDPYHLKPECIITALRRSLRSPVSSAALFLATTKLHVPGTTVASLSRQQRLMPIRITPRSMFVTGSNRRVLEMRFRLATIKVTLPANICTASCGCPIDVAHDSLQRSEPLSFPGQLSTLSPELYT